jgi:hypothetical protein
VIRPHADDDLGEVLDAWYLASLEGQSFLSEDFLDAERERLSGLWLPGSDSRCSRSVGRSWGSC